MMQIHQKIYNEQQHMIHS